MSGSELTEFLLARLAEDEAEGRGEKLAWGDLGIRVREAVPASLRGRWLAEVAAKRAIVELHHPVDPCDAHNGSTFESVPCETLATLAAIYADHPDFREEWRV